MTHFVSLLKYMCEVVQSALRVFRLRDVEETVETELGKVTHLPTINGVTYREAVATGEGQLAADIDTVNSAKERLAAVGVEFRVLGQ